MRPPFSFRILIPSSAAYCSTSDAHVVQAVAGAHARLGARARLLYPDGVLIQSCTPNSLYQSV